MGFLKKGTLAFTLIEVSVHGLVTGWRIVQTKSKKDRWEIWFFIKMFILFVLLLTEQLLSDKF